MDTSLDIIGTVRSPLTDIDTCPKQYSEGAPEAEIEISAAYTDALHTLEPGADVLVFTWLHKASRKHIQVHPRGNRDIPKKGVFNTRSPDRPNPIGLHHCRVLRIEGTTIRVDRLEVLDGTPVVDIKPAGSETADVVNWGAGIPSAVGNEIQQACRAGWSRGLFSGFNGNVSMRVGNQVIITRSGAAKGFLDPGTLTVLDLHTGKQLGPGKASSESPVHLEVYRNAPQAKAIVHTHPPNLLAFSIRNCEAFMDLPLFEAKMYQAMLTRVPAMEPGTPELGAAVGQAAQNHKAVFMHNHGLVCWGETPIECVALSEELDSLARIALLSGQ